MDESVKIIDRATGKTFEIPPEGSLGLLALGAIALKPWRQQRIESGFEKELLARVKEQVEEGKRKLEERRKKIEEAKLKKQQEEKKALLLDMDGVLVRGRQPVPDVLPGLQEGAGIVADPLNRSLPLCDVGPRAVIEASAQFLRTDRQLRQDRLLDCSL
jgi:uncharacterized FlaG/YvyC family protein